MTQSSPSDLGGFCTAIFLTTDYTDFTDEDGILRNIRATRIIRSVRIPLFFTQASPIAGFSFFAWSGNRNGGEGGLQALDEVWAQEKWVPYRPASIIGTKFVDAMKKGFQPSVTTAPLSAIFAIANRRWATCFNSVIVFPSDGKDATE